MASPFLIIRRVVVDGELSCDVRFERGLNIIRSIATADDPRSSNKSGKTALVELIQHGLGRRQQSRAKFHFAPIIDKLEKLWLEVEADGSVFTVERSLQKLTARARVHEGPFFPGMEGAPAEVVSIEDMSTLFLNALNIPEVVVKRADGTLDPLSFPTIMRAFILHQEDSFGAILDKMIPQQRRTDVIGFLTGITPVERFTVEDELGRVQMEAEAKESYFRAVQTFLLENRVPSIVEARALVNQADERHQEALSARRMIQSQVRDALNRSENIPGRIDNLRRELLQVKERIAQLELELHGLRQEEERIEEVLASIKMDRQKTRRLLASSTILSTVDFSVCPRCLLEITPEMRQREQYARCQLCNRPLRTTSDTPPRVLPDPIDITHQVEETENILGDIRREMEEVQAHLKKAQAMEHEVGQLLDIESSVYVSPTVDRILAQTQVVAEREAELARARELLKQAEALAEIRIELDALRQQQAELEEMLREARKSRKSHLSALRANYEQILIAVDFPDFVNSSIDPRTLMPTINGSLYTHTGTALKGLATVCYHLALLQLSRTFETFFPRMLVIDSPAVGDLNDENHDKLLSYLAALNKGTDEFEAESTLEPDWQIILTTRRIIPELLPNVTVEVSAPDRMLLQ